jgi:endonuclease/exonuclease/phosphatase family metal-dependent hydrolase
MLPNRISMVTYNLWNTERWPDREGALRKFLIDFRPDILCLQELRNETKQCISGILATHDCVKDEAPGWTCESNIFWNKDYFTEMEHGLEKLKMSEQNRGFFWVRLKFNDSDKSIFVATSHFTYQGHPDERESGLSPRNRQARESIDCLRKLVHDAEPAFFMGDLNDPVMPRFLFPEAGFESCFRKLNVLCPPTFPAIPTTDAIGGNQAIDWVFANENATPISASVPQSYTEGISPSDHWPIHAMYQI